MGYRYKKPKNMRTDFPPEEMAGISHHARKVIRDFAEALAEHEMIGTYDPRDHEVIEENMHKCKRALYSYMRRLEADKIVKERTTHNAIYAK